MSTAREGAISNSSSYLQCSSKCLVYCKHIINDGWMDAWIDGWMDRAEDRALQTKPPPLPQTSTKLSEKLA